MFNKILTIIAVLALGASTAFSQTIDGRDFSIDGFAAHPGTAGTKWYHAGGTTGGAGGKVVKAETFSELQAYLQSSKPYIIIVDHEINTGIPCYVDDLSTGHLTDKQDGSEGVATTYGERIMIASNKTLIGVTNPATGKAPLFERITFVMQCTHNVIIRNCRFTMVGAPILRSGENKIVAWRNGQQVETGDPDCIGIQADATSAKQDAGSHIWIDHCEFFNGGAANKDRYDGLLDCKNNIQWLTFSYNYFHNHDKACLWGKGDSDVFEGCRTISAHHNMYRNIDGSRLPLQRGGHVHYLNNYQEGCSDGWDLRSQSVGYADACYFRNSKAPILPDGGGAVNICQEQGYGIVYDNCQRVITGTSNISYVNAPAKYDAEFDLASLSAVSSWVPTQTIASYRINNRDKAEDVPTVCEKYSGAGKITIWNEEMPQESLDDFTEAVSTALTGNTYDASGNQIKVEGGSIKLQPTATLTLSRTTVNLTDADKTVGITVEASDADGSVTSIQLLINDTEVAAEQNANSLAYTYTCTAAGTVSVAAVVTDNDGQSVTKSALITVSEGGNTNPGGEGGGNGVVPSDGKVMLQSDNIPQGFAVDGSATVEAYVYSSDLCRDAKLFKVLSGKHTITLPSNMKVLEATLYAVGDNNTANKGKITELAGQTFGVDLPSRKEGTAFATATATGLSATGSLTFTVTYASGVKLQLLVEEISTGIRSLQTVDINTSAPIYNLQGQRILCPTPGQVYIINGRKVIMK